MQESGTHTVTVLQVFVDVAGMLAEPKSCLYTYTVTSTCTIPFGPSHLSVVICVDPFSPTAAGGPQKLIHVLHSSEYPKTTFAILDTMNCLVAGNALDSILAQLKSFYASRKGLKIEAKGYLYDHKLYLVKFGSITIGSASKGIVVEVRIHPPYSP